MVTVWLMFKLIVKWMQVFGLPLPLRSCHLMIRECQVIETQLETIRRFLYFCICIKSKFTKYLFLLFCVHKLDCKIVKETIDFQVAPDR